MNDAARELIGRTLAGRFRITGFLGEGAMAAVYRAEQDAEPRDVAVKVMHPELLQDDTFARRFAREAKAAARIVHPNSVRIVDHGADGELHYLAMELLVGQDLFDTLARERRLPEARALRIAIQVCAALEAAHAQRIVHRDLKPENVFIQPDPDDAAADLVKVLDFGIAKVMERDKRGFDDGPPSSESGPPSSMVLTRVGSIVGTPEYMAPEQALGHAVDARTDVYACGVLLFHMLTGRPPFVGTQPFEIMLQIHDKPPPAPSSLLPGIEPQLEALILRTLSKQPDLRPQSARALREELEALLAEQVPGARRSSAAPRVAGLPGVPGEVAISTEPKSSRRDLKADAEEPPATLRSRPGDVEAVVAKVMARIDAEYPEIAARAAAAPAPVEEPAAAPAKAAEAAPTPAAQAALAKVEDVPAGEPRSASGADATKPMGPSAEPAETAMFASARGGWMVPPWAVLAALAAILALLWVLGRGAH
jgi:serine/threonine-protein kinase